MLQATRAIKQIKIKIYIGFTDENNNSLKKRVSIRCCREFDIYITSLSNMD